MRRGRGHRAGRAELSGIYPAPGSRRTASECREMSSYRIAVNVEWTSKCNALCPMCPRDLIENPMLMKEQTWRQVLERLQPQNVFRAVIAGYGEPTTHTRFFEFVDDMRGHPVRFDMVSNGQQLDAGRIRHLDGAIDLLLVSFSSIDHEV